MKSQAEVAEVTRLDNGAAWQWSFRFFGTGFLAAPVVIWAVLMGLDSREPGFGGTSPTLLLLTALLLAIVGVGYLLTVGRTPREIVLRRSGVMVVKWGKGKSRVLRTSKSAYFMGLDQYAPRFLAKVPCELVAVYTGHGRPVKFIVKEGLLDGHLERAAGRATRAGLPALPPP